MTADSRSLLIIGGTGFFGKSFLDAFRRGLLNPWRIGRVIAAARHPERLRDEHPELVGDAVELVRLDITQARALPQADYVIHAANTTDARRYASDPQAERSTILAAARAFAARASVDLPGARIVYTSSGAVYGQQPATLMRLDEDAPLAAATGLTPYKRDYAEAKREAEENMARLAGDGACVAIARCFAFVGVHLPRDQHFAVGNFLADGLAGRAVTVSAQRSVIRSYMHADDMVRWLMTIADRAGSDCPVFNVGSDEAVEIADLAGRVARLYNVPVEMAERKDDQPDRYVPSIDRAAVELGLTLQFNLDSALTAIADDLTRDRSAAA